MADKNGNVKWPFFVASILGLVTIMITLSAFSVSEGEFEQFEKRFEDKFTQFDQRLDTSMQRLLEEIQGLKE